MLPSDDGLHIANPADPENTLPVRVEVQREIRNLLVYLQKPFEDINGQQLKNWLMRNRREALMYVARGLGFYDSPTLQTTQSHPRVTAFPKANKENLASFLAEWVGFWLEIGFEH